jgi:uncharacterized protein
MRSGFRMQALAALTLAAALVAQTPPAAAAASTPAAASAPAAAASAPAARLQQDCAALPQLPTEAQALSLRSRCVLVGVIPSSRRYAEARELARKSLELGDPAGGFMLYLAFHDDPQNTYVRDGKPDFERYRQLAQRSTAQRGEQVEAIDALAFAVGKGHRHAATLLAYYFHDTVAPRNVTRLGALVELLMRNGERTPELERFAREANAVERAAPATKASVRAFLEAYRPAVAAALAGYAVQTGGRSCGEAKLKTVSSGDISGAEYLPLRSPMASDSYLVRGEWAEFWTFEACGENVPVKVTFRADGWGGAGLTAVHNKGA